LRCTHTDYCHHGLLCSCLSLRDVHNSAKRNRSQRGNWRWRSDVAGHQLSRGRMRGRSTPESRRDDRRLRR